MDVAGLPATFVFGGGSLESPAILMLHGWTGEPQNLAPVADALRDAGMTVSVPWLPGHADATLNEVGWYDWRRAAEQALMALVEQGASGVAVLGYSLGGLLALDLAARFPLRGLVLVAPGIRIRPWYVGLAIPLSTVVRTLPVRSFQDVSALPLRSVREVLRLARAVKRRLRDVKAPTLLVQGQDDRVVYAEGARWLSGRLTAAPVELVWLANSGHNVLHGADSSEAVMRISQFLRECLAAGRA